MSLPIDFSKWIYGLIGSGFFLGITLIICGILGIWFWSHVGREYRKEFPITVTAAALPPEVPKSGVQSKDESSSINPPPAKPFESALPAKLTNIEETNSKDFWRAVGDYNKTEPLKQMEETDKKLRTAMDQIGAARERTREKYSNAYSSIQTNFNVQPLKRRIENDLSFVKIGYQQPKLWTRYVIEISGEELVFQVVYDGKSEVFYRTLLNSPDYGAKFEEGIKQSIVRQIKAEIERTD